MAIVLGFYGKSGEVFFSVGRVSTLEWFLVQVHRKKIQDSVSLISPEDSQGSFSYKDIGSIPAFGTQVYCPPQKGSLVLVLECGRICAGAAGFIKREGVKNLCCTYKISHDNLSDLK